MLFPIAQARAPSRLQLAPETAAAALSRPVAYLSRGASLLAFFLLCAIRTCEHQNFCWRRDRELKVIHASFCGGGAGHDECGRRDKVPRVQGQRRFRRHAPTAQHAQLERIPLWYDPLSSLTLYLSTLGYPNPGMHDYSDSISPEVVRRVPLW